ncbi:hypothetical protein B0J11DRAFT_510437 [Dendryphion nanum]|uniref:Uncharacterized protein n=1 Tax=Dendryphion nanum TaxID=256645 RepID=A0A9P9DBG7_9PLEO|nr:hypothetical protein B0J11DRAFT_510437 [Dendryphion nanum]
MYTLTPVKFPPATTKVDDFFQALLFYLLLLTFFTMTFISTKPRDFSWADDDEDEFDLEAYKQAFAYTLSSTNSHSIAPVIIAAPPIDIPSVETTSVEHVAVTVEATVPVYAIAAAEPTSATNTVISVPSATTMQPRTFSWADDDEDDFDLEAYKRAFAHTIPSKSSLSVEPIPPAAPGHTIALAEPTSAHTITPVEPILPAKHLTTISTAAPTDTVDNVPSVVMSQSRIFSWADDDNEEFDIEVYKQSLGLPDVTAGPESPSSTPDSSEPIEDIWIELAESLGNNTTQYLEEMLVEDVKQPFQYIGHLTYLDEPCETLGPIEDIEDVNQPFEYTGHLTYLDEPTETLEPIEFEEIDYPRAPYCGRSYNIAARRLFEAEGNPARDDGRRATHRTEWRSFFPPQWRFTSFQPSKLAQVMVPEDFDPIPTSKVASAAKSSISSHSAVPSRSTTPSSLDFDQVEDPERERYAECEDDSQDDWKKELALQMLARASQDPHIPDIIDEEENIFVEEEISSAQEEDIVIVEEDSEPLTDTECMKYDQDGTANGAVTLPPTKLDNPQKGTLMVDASPEPKGTFTVNNSPERQATATEAVMSQVEKGTQEVTLSESPKGTATAAVESPIHTKGAAIGAVDSSPNNLESDSNIKTITSTKGTITEVVDPTVVNGTFIRVVEFASIHPASTGHSHQEIPSQSATSTNLSLYSGGPRLLYIPSSHAAVTGHPPSRTQQLSAVTVSLTLHNKPLGSPYKPSTAEELVTLPFTESCTLDNTRIESGGSNGKPRKSTVLRSVKELVRRPLTWGRALAGVWARST